MNLNKERYTNEQYHKMKMSAAMFDNLEAMVEIDDHQKLFHKDVKVIKGRKIPIGTQGKVVWLERKCYSYMIYSTRIGIKTDNGVVYTDANNVEVME